MTSLDFIFFRFFVLFIILFSKINFSQCENVKKSIDENRDDNGEVNDDARDESMEIPAENETNNVSCTRRQNSLVHEVRAAQFGQFPFIAAVMSHQNEYLCCGSIIGNGLILTTAKCTDESIGYVLLNATKPIKDENTAVLHVTKTVKFPTYTGTDHSKDVGLIYTVKHNNSIASKIKLSNYSTTRKLSECECVGFGLNTEVGHVKELQSIGLEDRTLFGTESLSKLYLDCIETKVPTCFKDTGGPAIFDNELIGVVVAGQDDCIKEMTSSYTINKLIATVIPTYTFKSWLDEKIKKNEEQNETPLEVYPAKPTVALRHSLPHKMTMGLGNRLKCMKQTTFVLYCILIFF